MCLLFVIISLTVWKLYSLNMFEMQGGRKHYEEIS